MDDAEFSRLLDAYMLGDLPPADRQRLVAAALESSDRAIELAQVEEIRESLSDPEFRQSLVRELPDAEPAERVTWWQQWLRPIYLAPLAGGAAAAVVLLLLADTGRPPSSIQVAEGPGTPGPGAGAELPAVTPAAADTPPASQLLPLFALPASRMADLALMVGGERFPSGAALTASVTLPGNGHLVALVRGPGGAMRQVYPADAAAAGVLAAGVHAFSFSASGRLDPERGGASTLRVLFVPGPEALPSGDERWTWLAERANFDEVGYDTSAP